MPPKAKFTREQIIDAAFEIVRTEGINALTARFLGSKLGSSSRPVFTVFNSMEEVQSEVLIRANMLYASGVESGLKEDVAFKGVGKAYISFAAREPKLFQLLFMREQSVVPDMNHVLNILEENYDKILNSIICGYNLDHGVAVKVYKHLWIYSHGIASLIATGVCAFTEEEISSMLTEVFVSILRKVKAEGNK